MMPDKLHLFYLTLLIFLVSAFPIYAKGILDQTFGNGGIVVTNLGSEASVAGLKQQNDGKIVVLGKHDGFYIVLRYNTDGSLDNNFGTTGKIVTSYAASDAKVNFNIQTDGFIAVGNNSSVSRYTINGVLSETVNFTQGEVAGFGVDGKIATASLISASGTCSTQTNKINYTLYNQDGTLVGSSQFCSGGLGSTGPTNLWGIVSSVSNIFYIGYNHQGANARHGRIAFMSGTARTNDYSADFPTFGYNLVDLSSNVNNGFTSLGYQQSCRLLPSYQCKNLSATPPINPLYSKIHGNNKTAFLKNNSKLLVWNEASAFQGTENINQIFGSATVQSSVYVQNDDKIIVAGQTASGGTYKNIGLVRYSTVIGISSPSAQFDRMQKPTYRFGDLRVEIGIFKKVRIIRLVQSVSVRVRINPFRLTSTETAKPILRFFVLQTELGIGSILRRTPSIPLISGLRKMFRCLSTTTATTLPTSSLIVLRSEYGSSRVVLHRHH